MAAAFVLQREGHRCGRARAETPYAERIERFEHATLYWWGAMSNEQPTRTHGAARWLLEELTDIERSALQHLQNTSVLDDRLARRLQQGLDLQLLRDGGPTHT